MDLTEMLFCRDELRAARATALADAEGFLSIVHTLELIGQLESKKVLKGLGDYAPTLSKIAHQSVLAADIPTALPQYHNTFDSLFPVLYRARNDAVHQGVYARTLTDHAVEISIVLEDALMKDASDISHFMVRNVAEAKPWHSISYARQMMLKNAFSYLPLWHEDSWWLVADYLLAQYVRVPDERRQRLVTRISDVPAEKIRLRTTPCANPQLPISTVLGKLSERPLLVVDPNQGNALLGLLTASDVL